MFNAIRRGFYWEGLETECHEFVAACERCKTNYLAAHPAERNDAAQPVDPWALRTRAPSGRTVRSVDRFQFAVYADDELTSDCTRTVAALRSEKRASRLRIHALRSLAG